MAAARRKAPARENKCRIDGYLPDQPVDGLTNPPEAVETGGEELFPHGHPLRMDHIKNAMSAEHYQSFRTEVTGKTCRGHFMVLILCCLVWAGIFLAISLSRCVSVFSQQVDSSDPVTNQSQKLAQSRGKCAASIVTPPVIAIIAYIFLWMHAFTAREGLKVLFNRQPRRNLYDACVTVRKAKPVLSFRVRCGHSGEQNASMLSVILGLARRVQTYQRIVHVPLALCVDACVAPVLMETDNMSQDTDPLIRLHTNQILRDLPPGPILVTSRIVVVAGDTETKQALVDMQHQLITENESKDEECNVECELFLPNSGYVPCAIFVPEENDGYATRCNQIIDGILFHPATALVCTFFALSWLYWQALDRRLYSLQLHNWKVAWATDEFVHNAAAGVTLASEDGEGSGGDASPPLSSPNAVELLANPLYRAAVPRTATGLQRQNTNNRRRVPVMRRGGRGSGNAGSDSDGPNHTGSGMSDDENPSDPSNHA
jgi:hypothetical protein